jgi:hypothetical protein
MNYLCHKLRTSLQSSKLIKLIFYPEDYGRAIQ